VPPKSPPAGRRPGPDDARSPVRQRRLADVERRISGTRLSRWSSRRRFDLMLQVEESTHGGRAQSRRRRGHPPVQTCSGAPVTVNCAIRSASVVDQPAAALTFWSSCSGPIACGSVGQNRGLNPTYTRASCMQGEPLHDAHPRGRDRSSGGARREGH
jgi:hypothetical protein